MSPEQPTEFRFADYKDPKYLVQLFKNEDYKGMCYLEVQEGMIPVRKKIAILNAIFWIPLIKYGIIPTKSDFKNYKSLTAESISNIQSRNYLRILFFLSEHGVDMYTFDYMEIIRSFAENINFFYNIIVRYLSAYMPQMDVLGLAKLVLNNPQIKKLVDEKM